MPKSPSASSESHILIYTDGGCIDNPGPGGFGAIVIINGQRKELSGGFRLTTNNRMELTAAIVALQSIPLHSKVMLYSDSRYLVDSMEKGWARSWQANKWRKADKTRALNIDLWQLMLSLCNQLEIKFVWVEGHAGHPENERCDRLAVESSRRKNLPVDSGYEVTPKAKQLGLL
jgi:ribonuclease HI